MSKQSAERSKSTAAASTATAGTAAAAASTAAASTSTTSTAAAAKQTPKTVKIGVTSFDNGDAFFEDLRRGREARAGQLKERNVEILEKRTPFSAKAQLTSIEELEAEGANGILIVTPFDTPELRKKINALYEKGIPCITVNSDISDSKRIAYVGCDGYKAGCVAGGMIKMMTHENAEIAVITGSRDLVGHEQRISGFIDTLRGEKHMAIEVIAECLDDDYKAYEIVQRIALNYPTLNTYFFAGGGVMGGCKGIYQMTLRRRFSVLTFDDIPATKEYIEKGIIAATICQEPERQGAWSLSILADYLLDGKKPENELNYTDIQIKIKESL